MFDAFCLGVAMTVGQGSPPPEPIPQSPRTTIVETAPRRIAPTQRPSDLPPPAPGRITVYPVMEQAGQPEAKAVEPKVEEKKEAEEKEDKRGYFMKLMDEKGYGDCLKEKCINISGWIEGSYTKSKADGPSNLPLTWNDRANRFLLNQFWLRINSPIDTEKNEDQVGYNLDFLWGSDYRYTLQRGFLNSQLINSRGGQNIHGFDMPQAYVNAYTPDIMEGAEIRIGKFFTPFGYESVEGPTTPLLSRSYAFNWAPPFTHWGVLGILNLDKNYQVAGGIVNGNDVMFLDDSEEYRVLAKLAYTSDDKNTTWAFGTSLGRGRFNPADRFAPSTVALPNEPAGRNNINVFDFTITEIVSDEVTLGFEAIYGYQTNVPANIPGGLIDTTKFPGQSGTAHWASVVGYTFYKFSDTVTGVARGEVFWDCEGQRTGFVGPYYAGTLGLQIRPTDCLLIRPEVRWDQNWTTKAFDGGTKNGLGTAAIDVVLLY
jgi:hypothetical protein